MPDLDDVLEEFERQWATGRPDLVAFVESMPATTLSAFDRTHPASQGADDASLLAELIKIDLHYQWQVQVHQSQLNTVSDSGGNKPPLYVEDYVQRFTQVDLGRHLLSLVEEELLARRHVGQTVTLDELTRRFPALSKKALDAAIVRTQDYVVAHHASGADGARNSVETFEDRFEILGVLGQGGMGRVYLAFDPRLKRRVAIKVPIFDLRHDAVARQRFLREGQVAASLKHPNVVTIYEIGELDDQCFIVAEYVDGPTLGRWLADQPKRLTPEQIAELVRLIARAVHAAHRQGVLHRDLKPANVLLETTQSVVENEEGWVRLGELTVRPRITDFGLASCADELSAITTTGAVLGTAAYMAPEQATGQPVGPQADVYAIGLILYEMLFASRPFAGKSLIEVMDRFRGTRPIELPDDVSVSPDLRVICERCLQFDVRDRYATALEVAEDLQRFGDGEPVHARPITAWERLRRFASMPDRIRQAAITAVLVESGILFSFLFVVVMQIVGASTGIGITTRAVVWDVAKMIAFPTVPIIVFGVLTLRGNLLAFAINLCLSVLMLLLDAYNLAAPEPTIAFYRESRLATFTAHSLVLGLATAQLAVHVIAIPASLQIRHRRLSVVESSSGQA